jgi:hypothetical protein
MNKELIIEVWIKQGKYNNMIFQNINIMEV